MPRNRSPISSQRTRCPDPLSRNEETHESNGHARPGCRRLSRPRLWKQPGEERQRTIPELLTQFKDSYRAADAAAVVALCHFPFDYQGATIQTPAQLQALLQSSFDQAGTISTVELLDPVIYESGDSATVTGTFRVVDTAHGETRTPIVIEGQRIDGAWRATSFTPGPV